MCDMVVCTVIILMIWLAELPLNNLYSIFIQLSLQEFFQIKIILAIAVDFNGMDFDFSKLRNIQLRNGPFMSGYWNSPTFGDIFPSIGEYNPKNWISFSRWEERQCMLKTKSFNISCGGTPSKDDLWSTPEIVGMVHHIDIEHELKYRLVFPHFKY